MKDSLRKSPKTKQAKTKKNRETQRYKQREREPELTHLFKNNSFDISLYREFLYTSHAGFFFYVGSFSYTSRPGLFLIFNFYLGSFPHTSRAGFIFMWGVSLTHPVLSSFFFIWEVSLIHPVLVSFFLGRNSPQINETSTGCLFDLGSFSYTSRAGFIFLGEKLPTDK